MIKRFLSVRKFLNKKNQEGLASIIANVSVDVYPANKKKGTKKYVDADTELIISDCSRIISFDFFDFERSKTRFNNAIFKLNNLIDTLIEFREALKEAREYYQKEIKP